MHKYCIRSDCRLYLEPRSSTFTPYRKRRSKVSNYLYSSRKFKRCNWNKQWECLNQSIRLESKKDMQTDTWYQLFVALKMPERKYWPNTVDMCAGKMQNDLRYKTYVEKQVMCIKKKSYLRWMDVGYIFSRMEKNNS